MENICVFYALGLLIVVSAVQAETSNKTNESPAPTTVPKTADKEVRRGELLATFGGSGHLSDAPLPAVAPNVIGPTQWGALATNDFTAWAGPWDVSFAATLTPDVTGLGPWTAQDFIHRMRAGKQLGVGRALLPPMAWLDSAALTERDLRVPFKYLQPVKRISNQVPQPIPPHPPAAR